MSDYFDRLPSREREKIRQKMRSPEAYEALREKVKGPEDLEREMKKSERLAELHLALETEPGVRATLKSVLERDIAENGIEQVLEADGLSQEAREAIQNGMFDVEVDAHPQTHEDVLVIMTEGNVRERVPVQVNFGERYVQQRITRDE